MIDGSLLENRTRVLSVGSVLRTSDGSPDRAPRTQPIAVAGDVTQTASIDPLSPTKEP